MPYHALDEYIKQQIDNTVIPGAVLLISNQGKILHHAAYGYAQSFYLDQQLFYASTLDYPQKIAASIKPLATPLAMTTQHVFDLASVTKVLVTAFALMLLLDRGDIKLDDPVRRYLPSFDTGDKRSITLAHLTRHSAGFMPWLPLYYHANNPKDAMDYIAQSQLVYMPGTRCLYSDLSFITLGYLIEQISGDSLDAFIKKNLFQKLNLSIPTFNPIRQYPFAATSHGNPHEYQLVATHQFDSKAPEKIENFSQWRNYTLVGEANDGNAFHTFHGMAGHAGLFATASDVKVLLDLINHHGQFHNRSIIRPETLDLLYNGCELDYCLGWKIMNQELHSIMAQSGLADKRVIGHTGFTGALAVCIPAIQFNLVLLTNRQNLGMNIEGRYNDVMALRKEVIRLALLFFQELQGS